MNSYIVTDLVFESLDFAQNMEITGYLEKNKLSDSVMVSEFTIQTNAEEAIFKKPKGRYIIFFTEKIWKLLPREYRVLEQNLINRIRSLIHAKIDRKKQAYTVLIVGLGNPNVLCDSLGPATVQKITPFCSSGASSITVLTPNVEGNTGIASVELIKATVSLKKPDIMIVVDALAARSCHNLAATIQISDAGIFPGSGVGKCRYEISLKSMGVPVVSIGVPTVVHTSTLMCDVLAQAGMRSLITEVELAVKNGMDFFVTPQEMDFMMSTLSSLLSTAIETACME